MQTIKIGATNWEVSNVALGIMRMGTLPVAEAVKTLQAAHEAGINFIDSADIYASMAVIPNLVAAHPKFILARHSSKVGYDEMISTFNPRLGCLLMKRATLHAMILLKSICWLPWMAS